jgi:hypothetical protein
MEQIWSQITALDWVGIITNIVQAICFILTCFLLINGKVQQIKYQNENAKLKQDSALKDAEYAERELKLKEEFNDTLRKLNMSVTNKIADEAAKKEAKAEAETLKISDNIKSAQASIDQILHAGKK